MFWKEIINHEMEFGWKKSEDADWLVYMKVHFEVACTFSSDREKKKKNIWLMKYIIIGLWSSKILQSLRILKKNVIQWWIYQNSYPVNQYRVKL